MNLLLDIHQLRPNRYAYSIKTDGRQADGAEYYESAFDSLETCLRDAGDSIGHYFPSVHMRYEGRVVGACATESLRRNPKGLAERFLAALTGRA
ncbi:hypothetical protein ACFPPF_03765 [Xenophilus aerolatus]|nr:hypothetical protein [Xenophilus aerolatus]